MSAKRGSVTMFKKCVPTSSRAVRHPLAPDERCFFVLRAGTVTVRSC
jgi:hypothetical protein